MIYNWNGKDITIRKGVIPQIEKLIYEYRARWSALPPYIMLGPNDFLSLNLEFCELAKTEFMGLRKIEILGIPVLPKQTHNIELGITVELVPYVAMGMMNEAPKL